MFEIATVTIVLAAVLVLYRAVVGPFVFNRIMSVNFFGTKTVVILVLVGFMYGRPDVFLDIAIVYALINFTAVLAFLKYVESGRFDR
nr:monovalent cation/H+ antiporter complex subunit F [Desulforamulus aquiferis]